MFVVPGVVAGRTLRCARWTAFIFATLACAATQHSIVKPGPDTPLKQPALSLPAAQRVRVSYALDAVALVARDWPVLMHEDTCILLIGLDRQWGLNCSAPPNADFMAVNDTLNKHPVFVRRSGSLNVEGRATTGAEFARDQVAIPAGGKLVTGMRDLSAGHAWIAISTLEALAAEHPQFKKITTEEWLAVFIHEYFHTRQLASPEFLAQLNSYDVSTLDRSRLDDRYTSDPKYRELVEREHALLSAAAYTPTDAASARAALTQWSELYRARRALLAAEVDGHALLAFDAIFTYIEGVARFVENQFFVEAGQHPARDMTADPLFSGFVAHVGHGRAGMLHTGLGTQYYYEIGANLSALLDHVDPAWKSRAHTTHDFVIGIALAEATR